MATTGQRLAFANEQGLMPWERVADELAKRTGRRISRARVMQIGQAAERKFVEALMPFARDEGWIEVAS